MKKKFLCVIMGVTLSFKLFTSTVFANENTLWNNVEEGLNKTGEAIAVMVTKDKPQVLEKKSKTIFNEPKNNSINKSKNLGFQGSKNLKVSYGKESVDKLYSDAYKATNKCLNERTQLSIREAREAIGKLPKSLHWAVGEFSKQVDSIQQPIFVNIIDLIKKSNESKSQIDINKGRELVKDVVEKQYGETWNADLDRVQQEKISSVVNGIKKAKIVNYNTLDLKEVKKEIDDIKKVRYNDCVKKWVEQYSDELDDEISKLKELTNNYAEEISKNLNEDDLWDIEKCRSVEELVDYLKTKNANADEAFNAGIFWAANTFSIPAWGIESYSESEEYNKSILELAKFQLELGDLNNIISNIKLPTSSMRGDIDISWESSDENVIDSKGKVKRPSSGSNDKKVTLTATLSKGDLKERKEFLVTVIALSKKLDNVANSKEEFKNVFNKNLDKLPNTFDIKVNNYNKNDYSKNYINALAKEHYVFKMYPKVYYYCYDEPNISYTIKLYGNSQAILTFNIKYDTPLEELKKIRKVNDEANRIIDEVTHPNMTDFEKELALHDYIVKTVEYDKSVLDSNELKKYIPENHSPYGPIILHKGVCEGYAKAMFVLLNKAGVQCEVVVGEGINSLGRGGHAWNIVKLDGEWYNLDVTWDDPLGNTGDYKYYLYFNVTDEQIKGNHIRDERSLKEYPQCNGTKYSFINMFPDPDWTFIIRKS